MTTTETGRSSDPLWRKLYEAAILELDLAKMPDRIEQAKKAILTRVWDLRCDKEKNSELNRLKNALNVLDDLLTMSKAPPYST